LLSDRHKPPLKRSEKQWSCTIRKDLGGLGAFAGAGTILEQNIVRGSGQLGLFSKKPAFTPPRGGTGPTPTGCVRWETAMDG
jgi:hypothetical protein